MSGLVGDTIGAADPVVAAEEAGLSYVRNHENGIRRLKTRSGFRYIDPKGKPLSDEATLKRIRSLVIPPAWTNVWICASPTGHIQAVGRDARGRKQYRYHTAYRYQRDQTKYERMLEFGKALPQIRQRVAEDLQAPGFTKRKVMATVISILERTCMRVGNEEYRDSNESYGLTTLQDKHVQIEKSVIRFRFRGKSGQDQDIKLEDPQLARIVKKCRDIPGYELFQYLDEDGTVRDVTSSDVNDYIREVTGQSFTAKDFRTWGGTGWATVILSQLGASETENDAKKAVVEAIKEVSKKLGNRPATCKKYYVHPAILDAFSKGELTNALQSCEGEGSVETCVMHVVSSYIDKVSQEKKASSDLSHRLKQSIRRQTKKRQQETAAL